LEPLKFQDIRQFAAQTDLKPKAPSALPVWDCAGRYPFGLVSEEIDSSFKFEIENYRLANYNASGLSSFRAACFFILLAALEHFGGVGQQIFNATVKFQSIKAARVVNVCYI